MYSDTSPFSLPWMSVSIQPMLSVITLLVVVQNVAAQFVNKLHTVVIQLIPNQSNRRSTVQ